MPNDLRPPVRPPSTHVSQSECKDAQDCGMRWYAKWCLGVRTTGPEGPAQRVGSLGHAAVAAQVLGAEPWGAMLAEAVKRRYAPALTADGDPMYWGGVDDDLYQQGNLAVGAVRTLVASSEWDVRSPLLDASGAPVVERTLRASWHELLAWAGLELHDRTSVAFLRHRHGMEGTPDVCHLADGGAPGADLFLDDYKMRTRPVDGDPSPSTLPDPQGAFYKVLLRATGLDDGSRDVVFRQVNVYAGRWLSLDDFLEDGSPLVNDNGLPTRDAKRMQAMVRAEVWSQAWHHLVERRRVATAHRRGGPREPTPIEQEDARRFADELSRRRAVQVTRWRLDHSVCVEVVRDMLTAVAARLAEVDAGVTPGRHLRTYPSSPCARPFGCDVQGPCLASLGSGNTASVFREQASVGRYAMAGVVADVGEHDDAEGEAP